MKNKIMLLLGVIVIVVILNGLFIIDETKQAIITQFGSPVGGALTEAGLQWKIPFIQKVHVFEKRILEWDGDPKQIPTADKKYLWIDIFARWQITDPLKFYQTTRNESFAHGRLDDIISGTTRDIISLNNLIEVVRDSNRNMNYTIDWDEEEIDNEGRNEQFLMKIGREAIADSVFSLSIPKIEEYGMTLLDVQIKRVNYIDQVREKVYERMISERNKIAAKYLSAGKGEGAEIMGKMQRELDKINSEAYKKSREIRGKADADATAIFANAYNRDPDFYQFIKTLETYKTTIGKESTIIFTTDNDYFKYFKSYK
ncbi:MAG: protease modulator HflC [Candidatus Cloacimonadota bacterium]|nr:protease modulator HflC [Candidatus Cloacimonadota bacterium]